MYGLATSFLPSRGSPTLDSGGQIYRWRTSGHSHYTTTAVKGNLQRFIAGDKIKRGIQVRGLPTSPQPFWGSPMLHSGGENHKWRTSGWYAYTTPTI